MRNLIAFLWGLLSLAAGEAEGATAETPPVTPDKPVSPEKGGAEDGGGFFDEDEPAAGGEKPKVKPPAKVVTADPEEDDPADEGADADDDEEEDEDAESEEDGDNSEGDGGENRADSAAAISIRRGWEARFAADSGKKGVDPLAGVLDTVKISAATRDRVKAKFEAEDDVGAIEDVVREILGPALAAYDERRVTPVLDAAEVSARNVKLVNAVQAFDAKNPGARTAEVNTRMAALYDEFKDKHGYRFADAVPVEDYFHMAGGQMARKAKSKGTKAAQAEKDKQGAVQATRQPERVAAAAPAGNGKVKAKGDPLVRQTMESIQRTRFDPFVIR